MARNILIADDDPAMLRLYNRIFSDKEYSVTMAASFSEASGLIESGCYDLLVTDLMLTDGLGTELIRLFEKKRKGAKSMLVTGSTPKGEDLRNAGISDYFEKPFKVESFMSAVAKVLAA